VGKHADAIRRGIELFNQGKIREVLELYDDRATLESQGSILGGAYKGKEAIGKYFQQVGATFPQGTHLRVENIYEDKDTVIVEWSSKGKLANGKEFEGRAANIFEIKNDKVVHHRMYTDTEGLARLSGKL